MKLFCLYNIRPEVSKQDWERFLREEDIPFTLEFPSVERYRIFRNGGDPEGPISFQYLEEIDVTDLDLFRADAKTDRWSKGMDAWYAAGGATWCFFHPVDIAQA